MSLPSIGKVMEERGLTTATLSDPVARDVVFEAMGRDLPLGMEFFRKAGEKTANGTPFEFSEDPNSDLGKQIIRIAAGDVLRSLVVERLLNRRNFTFFNCCNGTISPFWAQQPAITQIMFQNGEKAYADC